MTLLPAFFFFFGTLEEEQMKLYMFIGAMIWFAGAIPWLGQKKREA
jgi:hypothetical protein